MKPALEKVVRLIASRDFLLFQRNLELRSDYVSKLGQYELAAFKISCEVERMRRKLSLAQERFEHGETLDEEAIDRILDQEFVDKDQILEEMTENLFMAMGFQNMPQMSPDAQAQMLYLYQQLAKVYYPQLYPGDKEKQTCWEKVRDLYRKWDLEALEKLEEEAEQQGLIDQAETQLEEEALLPLQKILQDELDSILKQFPFNLKELLEDEEQVSQHREEIRRAARKADQELQELQKKIHLLLTPVGPILH